MRILASIFLVLGLALYVRGEAAEETGRDEDDMGILECMFEDNAGNCLRTRLARDLDQIELEVSGKRNEPPLSAVVEQAGNMIAEVVDDLQETGAAGIIGEDDAQDDNIGEDSRNCYVDENRENSIFTDVLITYYLAKYHSMKYLAFSQFMRYEISNLRRFKIFYRYCS